MRPDRGFSRFFATPWWIVLPCLAVVVPPEGARGDEPLAPIPLWTGTAPGEKGDIGPEHDQPAKNPDDNVRRIADVSAPSLTIYRPPADKNNGAAVIICPGGGYNILAWNLEGTEIAEWLNSLGVTGIVLKYRVPARKGLEKYTAPLQDAQRAMSLVRQRSSEWGIAPDRIGILGFSAGGHLAAALSNNFATRGYEAVDEIDRVSCRPDFAVLVYPAYLAVKKVGPDLSPELKITPQTPPTFLTMTEDDDGAGVEGPLYYYLALKRAKVPAEMHLYPKGGHGYGLRPSKNAPTWTARAGDWLGARGLLEKAK